MLPLALLVGCSSTAFTVSGTAYLTGLRTNSHLFDPRVLAKFALRNVPPLCALVLLSFNYAHDPVLFGPVIAGPCLLPLGGSYILNRGIDRS